MTRLLGLLSLLVFAALAGATPALADMGDMSSVTPHPLEWATEGPVDWTKGGLLLIFGLAGALFTVFTLVGGAVPGTAGYADLQASAKRLETWTQELQNLITAEEQNPDRIASVNKAVSQYRQDLTRERRWQFLLASVIYLALGAFFAAVVAQDLLQAAAIGAGWTGIAGSLGLKGDYSQRKDSKDDAIDTLTEYIRELQQRAKLPPEPNTLRIEEIQPDDLLQQVQVARAL